MKREEFIELIKSIGFKLNYDIYEYKGFGIDLSDYFYYFYNVSGWSKYNYNDLTLFEECFKKELRSIKLKQLLYCNIS